MALLGAIIAGGKSTRFGSDKGAAMIDGVALVDHVANALHQQVDALVVIGRAWPGLPSVADHPSPGLGPLGGLCGALHYASEHGFEQVATTPCDLLPVPDFTNLVQGGSPIVITGHEVCGVWPIDCLAQLEAFIAHAPKLSIKAWIAHSGAASVVSSRMHYDLNTPEALTAYRDARDPRHDHAC